MARMPPVVWARGYHPKARKTACSQVAAAGTQL